MFCWENGIEGWGNVDLNGLVGGWVGGCEKDFLFFCRFSLLGIESFILRRKRHYNARRASYEYRSCVFIFLLVLQPG